MGRWSNSCAGSEVEGAAAIVSATVFYYDVSSPYAYLTAHRVDAVLPEPATWQPIAFGALIQQIGKIPWSLRPDTRAAGIAEVERRARERGLPDVRWPPGWPDKTYSVKPLRAILWAQAQHGDHELALALYRIAFAEGRSLDSVEVIEEATVAAGLDPVAMRAGIEDQDIKDALREATAAAIARGVTGVPTIAVGDELFWGDDRLEEAAAALSG
jgi:2-hydroxychromene-2-carboxylate isomerase